MTRTLGAVGALVAVYALMLVTADPIDMITGGLIASLVLVGLRPFLRVDADGDRGAQGLARRLVGLPAFATVVALDTIRGTWDVALVVLRLRPLPPAGLVEIPFEGRTSSGAVVTGLTATISPGEVLIDIDEERRVILMHVLDASDPAAVREKHQRRYQRWQRRVAP